MIDKTIFKFLMSHKPNAVAELKGGNMFPNIFGSVEFYEMPNGVLVVAEVNELPLTSTNFFAFHIHEGETCADDFSKTGGHYNPSQSPHPVHAGDLPPLLSCGGSAWQAVFTDRFKIGDVLGRTVVIHENPDDFTSQPAGNSGNKIACGEIIKI